MTSRRAFALVAGSILAIALFVLVVQPAVERGGWGELIAIAVAVVAALLFERWLRTR